MTAWFQRLGLRWPLIQAPMAGVQDAALAIAVGRAGALGSVPAAMLSIAALERSLAQLRDAGVTTYNVNFFCHDDAQPEQAVLDAWRRRLAHHGQKWGVDFENAPSGSARRSFDASTLDAIAPFRPRVVSFHFGLPTPTLLQAVKAWGATIVSSATTVDEAVWLQAHGADIIVAQGLEAGGHRGMFLTDDLNTQRGTMALLPAIVDAVDVPVIAAGGIHGSRGVAAAVALGAHGVQVGTAFLRCPEATTSPWHREALRLDEGRHTVVTNVFTGRPARGIVNRMIRELGPIAADAPTFPHAATPLAPLRAAAEARGCSDFSPLWSGQGGCGGEARTAEAVVAAMVQGFDRAR